MKFPLHEFSMQNPWAYVQSSNRLDDVRVDAFHPMSESISLDFLEQDRHHPRRLPTRQFRCDSFLEQLQFERSDLNFHSTDSCIVPRLVAFLSVQAMQSDVLEEPSPSRAMGCPMHYGNRLLDKHILNEQAWLLAHRPLVEESIPDVPSVRVDVKTSGQRRYVEVAH